MSWSWTLYRYLALQFLLGVAIFYGALLVLAFSIDIVDLLNRTAGRGVSTPVVIGMAVLQLPDLGQKLLPFAILGGAVFCFARLARGSELVVTRAAGVSAWEIIMPALGMAMAIGIFAVMVATPISARMFSEFAGLEARHIKGQASQLAVSENGLWLRQGDEKQQSVIHALRVTDQGAYLESVLVLLYRGADNFSGRIDAKSARLDENSWLLRDAWVSGTDGVPKYHTFYRLPTSLNATQIQESFASPDTLSFWQLPGFIRAAQAAGFSATRHQLYLYKLWALPFLFAAMVFMAASFSLRASRSGGMVKMILFSAACGLGVYFFQDLTRLLGLSGALPVLLAATAPAIAANLIGMTLVFSREDG